MAASLTRRIVGRIRPQILALNGYLRISSSESLGSLSAGNPTDPDEEIKYLASYVTTKIDEIVKFGKPPLPLVYGAEVSVDDHDFWRGEGDAEDEVIRLQILSRVAHFIEKIPQVDKIQIFHAKVFYRSMLNDDSASDLTNDDINTRVINVTQSYPKVGDYKVTYETNFVEDLGFDKWDSIEIIQALQVEFKLYIPDDIVSCKNAIDYIYDHRTERLSKEEFQKHIFLTGEFGASKSEFRRIFVHDKEKKKKKIQR
jgi:acyl carrier protein